MAMTLSEFSRCLDPETLPRILQIQSGIYCPGSVYELFGRACSLSTGELVKIIDITITRFITHTSDGTDIVLPLDYPGLFRVVADTEPYPSIREIVRSLKIGSHALSQPAFVSSAKISLPHGSLKKREVFRITSVLRDPDGGEDQVVCQVLHREPKFSFTLGLSQQGSFTEYEDDQFYTLQELARWKIPNGRKRSVTMVKDLPVKDLLFSNLLEDVCEELTLSPVYELQAVTSVGKDIVVIPSNLDVEIIEVTDHTDTGAFIQPLSLQDVIRKPCEIFPFVAEVIKGTTAEVNMPEELESLLNCTQMIVHGAYQARRILASEIRQESPRHFLIPASYNGRLKRRPREFPTAYDLKRAQSDTENLHVVATRPFDSTYHGSATVLVGDEFRVNKKGSQIVETGDSADSLTCSKIKGKSHESVRLPMFLDGGFMEVIHDKRQYSISEICRWFPLPFNVKVSVRDLSLKQDILAGVPGLRIEEEIVDPYLLVSTTDLSSCWEIAVNRTHMTLHVDKRWNGGEPLSDVKAFVEEISEKCYYTMRRYAVATVTPPPRPPKTPKRPPERPIRTQQAKPEKSTGCSSKAAVNRDASFTDGTPTERERHTVTPTERERHTVTPTERERHTVTPTERERHTVTPTERERHTVTPTERERHTVTPTERERHTVTPTERERHTVTPTERERHTVTPTERERHTVTPTERERHTVTPTERERHTVTPTERERHTVTPTERERHTVTPTERERHTVTPTERERHTVTPTERERHTVTPTERERHTTIPAPLPRTTLQKADSRGHSLEDVQGTQAEDDDAHDYEYIDEDELENIRRQFNEQSVSIAAKAKPSNTI